MTRVQHFHSSLLLFDMLTSFLILHVCPITQTSEDILLFDGGENSELQDKCIFIHTALPPDILMPYDSLEQCKLGTGFDEDTVLIEEG